MKANIEKMQIFHKIKYEVFVSNLIVSKLEINTNILGHNFVIKQGQNLSIRT